MADTDFLLQAAAGALEGFERAYVPFKKLEYEEALNSKREERKRRAEREALMAEHDYKSREADRAFGRQKELEQFKTNLEPPTPLYNTESGEVVQPPVGSKTMKAFTPAPAQTPLYDENGNITGYLPKGAKPAPKAKGPTDAQSVTGTYANRLEQSNNIISKLENYASTANPVAFAGQEKLPNVANALKSKEFQSLEQAQRNFVNAVLRKESGAVISPTEFVEAKKQYFAQPGDKPEIVKQKRQNRLLAIEQFKRGAGPGYSPSAFLSTPSTELATPAIEQKDDRDPLGLGF